MRKPKQPGLFDSLEAHVRAKPFDGKPVLDRGLARELADRGIAHSSAAAPEEWQTMIRNAIDRLARRLPTFTSDDLWLEVGPKAMYQANPSALGGVFRTAAAEGAIVCTEERRESDRPATHRRPLRVWRSLLYRAAVERF